MTNRFFTAEEAYETLQHSNDAQTRADAIVFLGEHRYAPSVPQLADLVRESDPGTRYLAAKSLGQIGDEAEASVPALLIAMRDNDMFLRAGITGALIKIGYPAVPGLTKALFDSNKAVRRAAAKALGKIGSDRCVPALINSLSDSDPGVRKFVREALERIDSPEARDALNKA
jgi:HEAT repeat protein